MFSSKSTLFTPLLDKKINIFVQIHSFYPTFGQKPLVLYIFYIIFAVYKKRNNGKVNRQKART